MWPLVRSQPGAENPSELEVKVNCHGYNRSRAAQWRISGQDTTELWKLANLLPML